MFCVCVASLKALTVNFPFVCYSSSQVMAIIKTYLEADPALEPGDIAVIAPTVNDNTTMQQLEPALQKYYTSPEFRKLPQAAYCPQHEMVAHVKTRNMEGSNTIDWATTRGKTVLLSITAAKGKTFRCVYGTIQEAIAPATAYCSVLPPCMC